ncbi:zinc-ribbon domain-containing protein [Gardnerella piotii]|uniref:zinc ribbon domain-containing protein n=1 Tax=Gardnerella piotii TaxID=2792977 RepID=UPI00397063EB
MKKDFCFHCGMKLDDDSKFCKNCGQKVNDDTQVSGQLANQSFIENSTERKTIYDGSVHKCSNCGEIIGSFVTVCPTCGQEIRGVSSISSARELSVKLEKISAKEMPIAEEKKSIMKMVFGKDFTSVNEANGALSNFEKQKEEEKASLIINFTVPNSKEDIMEFMILAASNINVKKGIDDVITKAWIAKLDQIYQKAQFVLSSHPDFERIQAIYTKKKKEVILRKLRPVFWILGYFVTLFAILLFANGMRWNATVTLIILGVIAVAVGIISVFFFNKHYHLFR